MLGLLKHAERKTRVSLSAPRTPNMHWAIEDCLKHQKLGLSGKRCKVRVSVLSCLSLYMHALLIGFVLNHPMARESNRMIDP